MLDVAVLGTPGFAVAGIPVTFRSRKAEGLLARLCLSPDGRMSRETAANLFWEDSSEHHARSSLRQTLLILRRNLEALGFDGLSSDKQMISVNLARVRLDLDDLLSVDRHLPARLLHEKRLSERLFEGGELLSEPFTAWLRERRRQLHDALRAMLEPLLADPGAARDLVEEAAIALLNLDATHEPACRAYIRARAMRGDYASALRAYEDLWNVLDDEFDTQPSSETQELIVDIKLGRYPERSEPGRPSASPVAGFEDTPSSRPAVGDVLSSDLQPRLVVVVGAMQGGRTGGEEDRDRLAQALCQDLICRLVRFRDWTVLEDLGEDLTRSRVPVYLILVSAAREGERVFCSVTVKKHRTGHYVWGRTCELSASGALSSQASLVAEIAMATHARVLDERHEEAARVPEASLAAYDRLVRVYHLIRTHRIEDSLRAEEMLAALINDFPRFAAPYACLAHVINCRPVVFPGTRHSRRALERATSLAGTAIGLDPLDSRAWVCVAWSAARQDRCGLAEEAYRKALDLNPCDPWTALHCALGLAGLGATEEAAGIARAIGEAGLVGGPILRSLHAATMVLHGDCATALAGLGRIDGECLCGDMWRVLALAGLGEIARARQQAAGLRRRIAERWVLPGAPGAEDVARWLAVCAPPGTLAPGGRLAGDLARVGIVIPNDEAGSGEMREHADRTLSDR